MTGNFWDDNSLNHYLGIYRRMEKERDDRIAVVRERIESGYYLCGKVALATAARMLQADAAPPPP
jgi:hypothetical protein